jgi:hypothetical protein
MKTIWKFELKYTTELSLFVELPVGAISDPPFAWYLIEYKGN